MYSKSNKIKFLSRDELKNKILASEIINSIQSLNTLVIINDAHRSTPSHRILKVISKIDKHKIKDLIIACGTHDPPTEYELSKLLRETDRMMGLKVHIHDSEDNNLEYYGTTSRGTILKLNPIIARYKHILIINSVEPHYFAGYTGGVKSIFPGLAAKSSVEKNHSWSLDENSGPTLIKNNPLQLDLWEGYSFVKQRGIKISAIQLINFGEEIIDISFGNLKDAFERAIETAEKVYVKKLDEPVDIIVSFVFPPLDRSLYQAQKGIENTRQVLKKGGTMILVAKCEEGIGNDIFFNTISRYNTPDEVIESLSFENYKFGDHKAIKFASIARDYELILVSELSINKTNKVFAKNISLYSLENLLLEESNKGKSIAIVLGGAMVTLSLND